MGDKTGVNQQNVSYRELAKLEREKGKKGENKGIPLPSSWGRMKQFLPNVQAKC